MGIHPQMAAMNADENSENVFIFFSSPLPSASSADRFPGFIPCGPTQDVGRSNGSDSVAYPGVLTLSSFHPGGANVLMADGSVRFLEESTNVNVILGLGTRAEGEVISADAY